MCIAIHSKGHLDIPILFEQNLVTSDGGDIKFIECYDIVLRNLGSIPIAALYFLSPRSNGKAVYDLIEYDNTKHDFNWIFENDIEKDSHGDKYSLKFRSSEQDDSNFDVVMLQPTLRAPKWMFKDKNLRTSSLFWSCDKVLGVINFAKSKKIIPFDSSKQAETTYWIRLAFESKIGFDQKLPSITFGPDDGHKVNIQPCVGMCPNTVLEVLQNDIIVFSSHSDETRKLATKFSNEIWNIFYKRKTSTQIADYRISVLTKRNVIVLNPYFTGKCSYVGMKATDKEKKDKIARLWYAGYNQFPEDNPVLMAKEIHSYLRENATLPDHGKTAHEIAALLTFENLFNTFHVCESMGPTMGPALKI